MAKKAIYQGRLETLRKKMERAGVDACLIPMGDFHASEYISPYFGLIEYYTGFTGSAGTLVVLQRSSSIFMDEKSHHPYAFFWTDGRYFLQAEDQLADSGVKLMKSGMEGVPKVAEFLGNVIADRVSRQDGEQPFVISFDGRVVSSSYRDEMVKTIDCKIENTNPDNNLKQYKIITDADLVGEVWDEDLSSPRPKLPSAPVWELPVAYAGKSREDKIAWLQETIQKDGADAFVVSALDEIAWLLNLRGNDVDYNPVFLSYLMLVRDVDSETSNNGQSVEETDETWKLCLYTNADNIPDALCAGTIGKVRFSIRKYHDFYIQLGSVIKGRTVWADEGSCSCRMIETISASAKGLIRKPSPIILEKAVKNKTEIENIRMAHIKDGVAVTKWICALKQMEIGYELTELSAAEILEEYRKQQPDYKGQSFAPIIAFREHGAIVHYEPTPETDAKIEFGKGDFLLADTGGHYLEGTTDITRTISLGEPSEEQKKHYTAVLKGHLALLDAVFLEGAAGSSLDQLARQPLYRLGLDYRHGTGHGVGYLLNVHESPNAFRMKYTTENVIKEGMVTSDEPGVYLEGRCGIRIESLILSVQRQETEYGKFLSFEPLTMVPFDRASIDEDMLSQEEKEILDRYHKMVFEKLSPYLTNDERAWLAEETKPFAVLLFQ
ncbi:MAG: aminopeptidase P family protein [Lachnospiraceae bacterium]|nr:aminopeptidase P family protein [Lachnospiraceae bacterium]